MIKQLNKRMKTKIILIIATSLLIFVGCSKKSEQNVSQNEVSHTPVTVVNLTGDNISKERTMSTKLLPSKSVNVMSTVVGIVEDVSFKLGDVVEEDTVLFTLDKEALENQLKDLELKRTAAELSIELQKNLLNSVKGSQFEQQKAQLEQGLLSAQQNYNDAEKNYNDMKVLLEQGAISKQQFTQVESGFELAKKALETTQLNYDLYMNDSSQMSVKTNEIQLRQAELQKQQLDLSISNLKDTLNDASVKAPINGKIVLKNVNDDQMISNSMVAAAIMQDETLKANLSVTEDMIMKINQGDAVNVTIPVMGEKIYVGNVESVSAGANPQTGLYDVEVSIDNATGEITTGMFAEISFTVAKRENVILVPLDAILHDTEGDYVFVVEEGMAIKRFVSTGIDNGNVIEVTKGIQSGDSLIVEGQNFLRDGEAVEIIQSVTEE